MLQWLDDMEEPPLASDHYQIILQTVGKEPSRQRSREAGKQRSRREEKRSTRRRSEAEEKRREAKQKRREEKEESLRSSYGSSRIPSSDIDSAVWRTSLLRALLALLPIEKRGLLKNFLEFLRSLIKKHMLMKVRRRRGKQKEGNAIWLTERVGIEDQCSESLFGSCWTITSRQG